MQIEIYPPPSVSGTDFALQWYDLEVVQVQFSLSQEIHEYNITDMNTFFMEGFEHSKSLMTFMGVLTVDSNIPGTTLEDKKDNLMEAASAWWTFGDQSIRSNCAQIKWRGWSQHMMIERLEIEKTAGDEEEYNYTLGIMIHEGI